MKNTLDSNILSETIHSHPLPPSSFQVHHCWYPIYACTVYIALSPSSGTAVLLHFTQAKNKLSLAMNLAKNPPQPPPSQSHSIQSGVQHSQPLAVILGVEADGLDGCHDYHHAEGDGNEQHDDMFGSVLQGQFLILILLALNHPRRTGCGGLSILLCPSSSFTTTTTTSSTSGPYSCHPCLGLLTGLCCLAYRLEGEGENIKT